MSRHLLPQVVTVSDIIYAFNGKDEERKTKDLVEISFKIDEDGEEKDKEIKRPKNIFKISFFILGLIMFFTSLFSFLNKREVLKQLLIGGEEASKIAADTSVVWTYVLLLLLMVTGLSSITINSKVDFFIELSLLPIILIILTLSSLFILDIISLKVSTSTFETEDPAFVIVSIFISFAGFETPDGNSHLLISSPKSTSRLVV